MKRFLALALTLLMLLSLAACGEEKRSSKKDKKEKTTTTVTETTPDVEPTNDIVLPTGNTAESGLTCGTLAGNTYENDYFGFGINVPSSWTTKSQSEIATLNGTDAATMQNDFESVAGKMQTSYLFYSIDNSTGNNLNVVIENLGLTNNKGMTGDEYLNAAKALLESTYESMGAENVEMEISTIAIDKNTYSCMEASLTMEGAEMSQLVLVVPANDYMAVITFTVADIDTFGYLNDYFYDL